MSYDLAIVQGSPAAAFDTVHKKFGSAAFALGWYASTALGDVNNHPMTKLIANGKFADATIEFFHYRAAPPGNTEVIMSAPGTFWLGIDSSGALLPHIGSGPPSYGAVTDMAISVSNANICDGAEHHVALDFDATEGVCTVYVDGVAKGSTNANPSVYTSVYEGLVVGSLQYTVNPANYGYSASAGTVDCLRLSNTRRYTAPFTPPTSAFVATTAKQVALYQFDGDAVDAVGAASAIVATILPNDANVVYSPGNWDVNATRAKTINAGAYARFAVKGAVTALSLLFDVSANVAPLPQIMARVDRGPWTIQTVASQINLTLPSAVGTVNTWGAHLVEIIIKSTTETQSRWSPQSTGVSFLGVAVSPSSAVTVPVYKSPRKFIVFGDSITEGVRTLQMTAASGDDTDRNDTSVGWAFNLTRELGAEIGVVGFGASGFTTGGSGGVPQFSSSFPVLWGNGPTRSLLGYDGIIINHGGNDGYGQSAASVTAAAIPTLNAIIAASGNTPIFFMGPLTGAQYPALLAAIAACSNSSRITWIDPTGWLSLSADTSDGIHPLGYVDMVSVAPRLAAVVNAKLSGIVNRWSHA